jgi:hypothetical protein
MDKTFTVSLVNFGWNLSGEFTVQADAIAAAKNAGFDSLVQGTDGTRVSVSVLGGVRELA